MKISVESDYAIRIIMYVFDKDKLTSGLEIVGNCKIPESMGLRILTKLTTNGLLNSIKGKNGGFFFSQDKTEISLMDIISIFDNIAINRCLINSFNCQYRQGDCALCETLKEVNNDIIKSFSSILISDLWKKQNIKR